MNEEKAVLNKKYELIRKLGRGGFGHVYLAKSLVSGEMVSIKRFITRSFSNGIDYQTISEILMYGELCHPGVQRFHDFFYEDSEIYLVSEYLPYTIDRWYREHRNVHVLKSLLKDILVTLEYLHKNGILHRDIKVSNIMVTKEGRAKLIDFGCATFYPSCMGPMISQTYSLYNRPPELLFNCNEYGPEADMWAFGCMAAELVRGKPLFEGENDFRQMMKIATVLGDIKWPGCEKLHSYIQINAKERITPFYELFEGVDLDLVDLISHLVVLDPKTRLSAEECLKHPFFR